MKKVYSIIILMCSFCMAGFASEATAAGQLPIGSNPGQGEQGARTVVITPTNSTSAEQKNIVSIAKILYSGAYSPDAFACPIGWIAANNLKIQTENNTTTSPGAGFMIHTSYDEHGTCACVKLVLTGCNCYRYFAFVKANDISPSNYNHLSSHISSLLKTKNYG